MIDKQNLASAILSHRKAPHKTHSDHQFTNLRGFQREKGSLVREILSFHNYKFSQNQLKASGRMLRTSELSNYFIKCQATSQQVSSSLEVKEKDEPFEQLVKIEQYLDNFRKQSQRMNEQPITSDKYDNDQENEKNSFIDLFLKKNETGIQEKSLRINQNISNTLKCESKSFNESTMALSKLQASGLSPHRKIRKTENFIPDKLQEISEDNHSESLFSLTQNQLSLSPENKINQVPKKEQVKKVTVDLNQRSKDRNATNTSITNQRKMVIQAKAESRFSPSLEQVQQYEQLFDCSSEKKKTEKQESHQGVFNYLKDKITKLKSNKNQRTTEERPNIQAISPISSNGSSLNSFHSMIQRQKDVLQEQGICDVNFFVNQAVKIVNQNIEAKDNEEKARQEENNMSSMFFPNSASYPSTVHKLDQRSNDKSELMKHIEDIQDYSLATQLFKKIEPLEKQEDLYSKLHKNITINLEDIQDEDEPTSNQGSRSIIDPSMPSFKMEHASKGHNNIPSCDQVSEANLDDLSNYYSDESYRKSHSKCKKQSLQQNYKGQGKVKAKIILKQINLSKINKFEEKNEEKQLIEDLKQDISHLKNKIETSYISNQSENSFLKQRSTTKQPVNIMIDLNLHTNAIKPSKDSLNEEVEEAQDTKRILLGINELKHQVNDLKKRMLQDVGINMHK